MNDKKRAFDRTVLILNYTCPHDGRKIESKMCAECFCESRRKMHEINPDWSDPVLDGRMTVRPGWGKCFLCQERDEEEL